ncbi:hypothetical protein Tco_1332853 [Tanacetum coccineum]
MTDLEVSSAKSSEPSRSRGTDLEIDVDVERSDKPHSEPMIDPVEAVIKVYFDFADIIRGSEIVVRVEAVTVSRDKVEASVRGMVVVSDDRVMHPKASDDIPEPDQEEGAAIESIQRDQGHMIVATGQQGAVLSERIRELERDNMRHRDMIDVTMPNTRSGATMTREGINKLIARQVAEALEARDASRNLEPLVEGGDDQEDENGDDYEGGNGNGNGNGGVNGNGNGGGNDNGNGNGNGIRNGDGNGGVNGHMNHNVNFRGFMPIARECTYQDFLK